MHFGMLQHLLALMSFPLRAPESYILMVKIVPCTSLKKCENAVHREKKAGRIIMYLQFVK